MSKNSNCIPPKPSVLRPLPPPMHNRGDTSITTELAHRVRKLEDILDVCVKVIYSDKVLKKAFEAELVFKKMSEAKKEWHE